MKLRELREESFGDAVMRWTPRRLDQTQMIEWCEKHAMKFLKNGAPIFRGIPEMKMADGISSNDGVLDTTKLKRQAAESNGYYNWWIDSTWKEFPKRSESIICSTDYQTAALFETVHLIIPADFCRIGICPDSDMWGSFPELNSLAMDAGEFTTVIADAIRIKHNKEPKNYDELVELMKSVSATDLADFHRHIIPKTMIKHNFSNLLELFAFIIDSAKSQFKSTTAAEFSIHYDKEIWVSGDVLQVNMHNISTDLNIFLSQFFKNLI